VEVLRASRYHPAPRKRGGLAQVMRGGAAGHIAECGTAPDSKPDYSHSQIKATAAPCDVDDNQGQYHTGAVASTRRRPGDLGYQHEDRSGAESDPDLLRVPKVGREIDGEKTGRARSALLQPYISLSVDRFPWSPLSDICMISVHLLAR
jgi:hypothetical protein